MRDMAKIVTVISKGKMFEKDKICYVSFEETAYECIVPITVNVGDKVTKGDVIAKVYYDDIRHENMKTKVVSAVAIDNQKPKRNKLILEMIK